MEMSLKVGVLENDLTLKDLDSLKNDSDQDTQILKTQNDNETQDKVEKSEKKSQENEKNSLDFSENSDNKIRDIKVFDQVIRFEIKEEVNSQTNRVEKKLVINIVDEQTGEVIRKIPPEELSDSVMRIFKLMGIMLDKLG